MLIPAAERTLRLIELLISRPQGWTPQELLAQIDMSRSSMYMLLRTLKILGYVEQAGKRGRYTPGPRLKAWHISASPSPQDLLVAFANEAAATPLAETLALALPAGGRSRGRVIIVAQVEGTSLVRSAFATGQTYSDLSAAAKILASEPDELVVSQGYALTEQSEAFTLALPVCRDGTNPEAALLLTAPTFRWTPSGFINTYLEELRSKAAHLSYRLGAPFYAPYRQHDTAAIGGSAQLSAGEIRAFLQGPWAASLACIRPDGRPHVIPVWQEFDGQAFSVIAWRGSQWAGYVLKNPNISLTVDEPWSPLRRIVVQGCAKAWTGESESLHGLVQRLSRRYLGQPAPAGLADQVHLAFRIEPSTLRGWRGLPGGSLPQRGTDEIR